MCLHRRLLWFLPFLFHSTAGLVQTRFKPVYTIDAAHSEATWSSRTIHSTRIAPPLSSWRTCVKTWHGSWSLHRLWGSCQKTADVPVLGGLGRWLPPEFPPTKPSKCKHWQRSLAVNTRLLGISLYGHLRFHGSNRDKPWAPKDRH